MKAPMTMTTLADDTFDRTKDALVRAAYRALLQREPDANAIAELRAQPFTDDEEAMLAETLSHFVDSAEFQSRQMGAKRPDFAPSTWARVEINGLKLWVDIGDHGVSRHCMTGSYEPAETTFVRNFLTAGMSFVDIGANIGWFTLNAAKIVGPTGRVISFEPRADTYAALSRSLEDNGYLSFCRAYNNAVGKAPGELLIGWNPQLGNPGGTWLLSEQGLQDAYVNSGASTQKTDVVTLDSIIGDASVDLIKIDVEGAEPLALGGAVGVLSHQRPTILCEINPSLLQTVSRTDAQSFVQTIEGFGYECRLLTLDGDIGCRFNERDETSGYDMINVVFSPIG
jgi:FkbM family methyltransferase